MMRAIVFYRILTITCAALLAVAIIKHFWEPKLQTIAPVLFPPTPHVDAAPPTRHTFATFGIRLDEPLDKQIADHPDQQPREDLSRANLRRIVELQAERIKGLTDENERLRGAQVNAAK